MKCANEGRLGFLQHLPWSICFDRLWLDGGKTFYANYLLHCVHHANGASKDDERRQVCHVLPGCHLRKELPFWRQCFTNRLVQPQGIDSMFCGNQLFSSVRVCHRREENVWRQVIGVMEAKIRSELDGVSGPLTSFFSSLEALVVKSKLHTYCCDTIRT